MKRYRCHKVVEAFKIGLIQDDARGFRLVEVLAQTTLGEQFFSDDWQSGDITTVIVSSEYMGKHKPMIGGYYVRYEDGYESYSPADAFERGYTLIGGPDGDSERSTPLEEINSGGLSFSAALFILKAGGTKIARAGWNGKGMWLTLSPGALAIPADKFWAPANRAYAEANGGAAQVHPYVTMKTADGGIVPWLCSQTDLLADDWQIVP